MGCFFFIITIISRVPADGDSTNAINGTILCSFMPNETKKEVINQYSCYIGDSRAEEYILLISFSLLFSIGLILAPQLKETHQHVN